MASRRYDALFVDFYGTLVTGDRQAVEDTCARIVADCNLAMTARELAVAWGHTFFETIERRNHDRFLNLFECECVSLEATLQPLIGPIDPLPYARMLKDYWCNPPPVPSAVAALARVELPICIVSNADTQDVLAAMERIGIRADAVITSEDVRAYKPDAAIFTAALRRMNTVPTRVLHVGDSLHSDVAGAMAQGIATCWVRYADRILDVGNGQANYKISDFSELHAILDDSGQ